MKQVIVVVLGLVALACAPQACRAEWGWPPPGFSPTGIRACDGSQYRGLCAVVRDYRHGIRPGPWWKRGAPGEPCPCAAPAGPETPETPAQAPLPPGSPRP
jgi:hypothetical protein